jgi:hypothetical protein
MSVDISAAEFVSLNVESCCKRDSAYFLCRTCFLAWGFSDQFQTDLSRRLGSGRAQLRASSNGPWICDCQDNSGYYTPEEIISNPALVCEVFEKTGARVG